MLDSVLLRVDAAVGMSRRARNRAMHALNGNGRRGGGHQAGAGRPPGGDGAEQTWRKAGRTGLLARELMEPQAAGRLRAAGWTLPEEIPAEYMLRVYDTGWMRAG